jgi:hypothetical protein
VAARKPTYNPRRDDHRPRASKSRSGLMTGLFIGLIMVLSSISLLQAAQGTSDIQLVLSVVVGVLALPGLDSLRVYRRRAKNGFSPFRADRTHFHHLVLQLGLKNRYSTVFVLLVSLALIALSVVMGSIAGFTTAMSIPPSRSATVSCVAAIRSARPC